MYEVIVYPCEKDLLSGNEVRDKDAFLPFEDFDKAREVFDRMVKSGKYYAVRLRETQTKHNLILEVRVCR